MSSTTISSAATSSAAMSPAATSSATMSSEWDKRFLAVPSPFGILRGGLPNKPINTEAEDGPVSARADAPNNVVPGDKTPILSLRSVASKSDLNVARSGTPATMRNDQCAPSTNSPAITSSYHLAASPPNIVVTSHTFHGHEVENAPPTPQLAPTKEPGLHDVDHAWGAYLDLNGFRSAFVPLRGTEWDRYRPIIEKGITEETERRASASEMLDKTEEVIVTIQNKLDMCHNRSPAQHQVSPSKKNGADQRTEKRLCSDLSTLINGRTKLTQFLEEYPRHERQYLDLHKGRCTTSYGILSACTVLPVNYWYAGHRPGDHIIRIRDKSSNQTIGEGDMFYVHDLAGTGNDDGMEKCGVRFEGVVPFNNSELYQRFTGYVFTNFVRMVIAAVGFDPENRNYEVHNLTWKIWKIQTAEFEDITEREKTTALKDLQSLWRLKYGTDRTNYPDFLKAQVATSISHLREMGWLMSKLERDAPHHAGHHYWKPCKGLLEDFAGRDAALLAQEYYDITLANEAAELLEDGCLDDILVYKQSKSSRGIAKLQDFYNTQGPGPIITQRNIDRIGSIVRKYLPRTQHPSSISRSQQAAKEHSALSISSTAQPTPSTPSTTVTTVTTVVATAAANHGDGAKKRKRPQSKQDDDGDGEPERPRKIRTIPGQPSTQQPQAATGLNNPRVGADPGQSRQLRRSNRLQY